MGISGLLPALSPIERSVDLRQYAGKTVAIDGHCILHRGAIDAAKEFVFTKFIDSYVTYFMDFMYLFKRHNVTTIVVFDGHHLPLRQATNDERRSHRQEALKEGLTFYLSESEIITNDMVIDVLRELSEENIQCIVAPNDADAQLTHLAKTGKVDAVITDDSNLLAFGCPKIIYNMNLYGQGTEITMDQVINNENSVFYNYDLETIRHICILSGCDYLPSIKQVSLKTILNTYKRNNNTDRALYNLQYKYKKDIPRGYFEKFYLANLGFLHQWVYDIDEKNYVRLNPLPKECSDDDIELLGRIPTVQDSTMFCVNEIIPKAKPKDNPQNNDGNSPAMNALDIRSSESSQSMPKVLTQSDRLETFYTKFHVFPRNSRKAIVESATPSMTATSENANSTPQSFSYDNRYALPTTSATPSAELTQSNGEELQIWKSYQENKPIPHDDVLHSTVKQASQNTECTTTMHKPSSSLKRSVSFFHEPLKDHDDTPEFSLPTPSSPSVPANQSLSPPFTASNNTMPENADSVSPPYTLTTETEQLSSSIPDTVSSPATATRGGQTSKSLSKKRTDPRLAKLHSTLKQSSQNMKNTRTIHKPSSSLKRSVSFFHEPLMDHDDTPEFSLPTPSSPTAPANQSLSPPFTASETAMPENADSGSPPFTLAAENEQLSSSITDTESSPATATRSGQTSKSLSKKRTDPRLAKSHNTVKK
ncbi:Rad2 nuclease [Mucor circinelloides]